MTWVGVFEPLAGGWLTLQSVQLGLKKLY